MKKIIYAFLCCAIVFQIHTMEDERLTKKAHTDLLTQVQKTKNSQKLAKLLKKKDLASALPNINAILEWGIDSNFKYKGYNLLQVLFMHHLIPIGYIDDVTVSQLTAKLIAQGCDPNVHSPFSGYSLLEQAIYQLCLNTSSVLIHSGAGIKSFDKCQKMLQDDKRFFPEDIWKRIEAELKEIMPHNKATPIESKKSL